MAPDTDNRSIIEPLFRDGRFLLFFTGLILLLSGLFVIVQSITGYFLPHDVSFIQMTAQELGKFNEGRITKFMFHDRVAFGGSIMAVGIIYMWLTEFPLKSRYVWSWWIFLFSGLIGFGSFLTYLGYGYFDSWHGTATIILIPFFVVGLKKSYIKSEGFTLKKLISSENSIKWKTRTGFGTILLIFTGLGIFLAGITIMIVGMTTIFVPQDLEFMKIPVCGKLNEINSNLIPLIAHDRACFGGGLATIGLIIAITVWKSKIRRSLWQVLFISLSIGFITAIGVHFFVGYTDFIHLLPAYLGCLIAYSGLALTYKNWVKDSK